ALSPRSVQHRKAQAVPSLEGRPMRHDDRITPSVASPAIAALGTATAYWAGPQLGLFLTLGDLPVSVLWPPNAILLGALLLAPPSRWLWYVLALPPVHRSFQVLYGI